MTQIDLEELIAERASVDAAKARAERKRELNAARQRRFKRSRSATGLDRLDKFVRPDCIRELTFLIDFLNDHPDAELEHLRVLDSATRTLYPKAKMLARYR